MAVIVHDHDALFLSTDMKPPFDNHRTRPTPARIKSSETSSSKPTAIAANALDTFVNARNHESKRPQFLFVKLHAKIRGLSLDFDIRGIQIRLGGT